MDRTGRRERPLVGERPSCDGPAAADLADDVLVRDPSVGQEHLVERCVIVHLPDRADLDARLVHVEQEVGHPGVLRCIPVGTGDEDRHVGMVGRRVPHLLAVDDPLIAVAYGGRLQARQIRAGAGLAEQLAPRQLAGQRASEKRVLQLVRRMVVDRRCGQADTAAERGWQRHRLAGSPDGRPDRPTPANPVRTIARSTTGPPNPESTSRWRHSSSERSGSQSASNHASTSRSIDISVIPMSKP